MTAAQREAARRASLEWANEIRTYRADLKLDLRTGHTTLAEVLREDDPRIQTMLVRDLLLALPALRAVKVRRALEANRMTQKTKLGTVNRVRREDLVRWLWAKHPGARGAIR
jgi:hypothetical protein